MVTSCSNKHYQSTTQKAYYINYYIILIIYIIYLIIFIILIIVRNEIRSG